MTVEKNLEKMLGEMQRFLCFETMGGNAGFYKEHRRSYPCAAVNFYYDKHGEIKKFSNCPDEKEDSWYEGTFRIAFDFKRSLKGKRGFFKIVNLFVEEGSPGAAIKTLEKSCDAYNAEVEK